jgi:hypothetical protein
MIKPENIGRPVRSFKEIDRMATNGKSLVICPIRAIPYRTSASFVLGYPARILYGLLRNGLIRKYKTNKSRKINH